MKTYSIIATYWILLGGILININEIIAQVEPTLEDIVTLCNQKNRLYCELLDTYKQQNDLHTLLEGMNDRKKIFSKTKDRNHISRRFVFYDNIPDISQYSFSGLKNPLEDITWNLLGKSRKTELQDAYNYDNKRTIETKKSSTPKPFFPWAGKRDSKFFNWGGKRIGTNNDQLYENNSKFFSWGGKRNEANNQQNYETIENDEHRIMKRNVHDRVFNKISNKNKRICIPDSKYFQEIFDKFLQWSKQQKKGFNDRKTSSISALHTPENINWQAGSFFPWGGKRNSKEN